MLWRPWASEQYTKSTTLFTRPEKGKATDGLEEERQAPWKDPRLGALSSRVRVGLGRGATLSQS